MLNSSIYVSQVSSHYLLQRSMIRHIEKAGLSTVRYIITLRNSILLAYHAVALDYYILEGITLVLLIGRQHTIPGLLLAWYPRYCVAIRTICYNLLDGNHIDLGR